MSSKDFFEGLGELIQSTFVLMELGGNNVNIAFILVGAGLMAWWIAQMFKFKKDAERNGGME